MGLGELAEFVYTVILKPRPLRIVTNAILKLLLPASVNVRGASLALNPNDPVVSGALTLGVYEGDEITFFLEHLKDDMTLVDVGANIGLYTCLGLASPEHTGRIVSFEPHPESLEYLRQNISSNKGDQEVVLVESAAAESNGEMTLYINPENKGDNRLYPANELEAATTIQTRSIDSVCDEHGITSIEFLKIDVQGAEHGVIKGGMKTLTNSTQCVLMTEFWPEGIRAAGGQPEQYAEDLQSLGFELHEFAKGELRAFDAASAIARLTGRKYTNLIGKKGDGGIFRR